MPLNPNDPVVEMLKNLVQQYESRLAENESKLDALAHEIMQSFQAMMQANAQLFASIQARLAALDATVFNKETGLPEVRQIGKEL